VLPLELERMGANVDEVTIYQTIQSTEGSKELIEQLHLGRIDMVTFTSSSTVRNFKALLPKESIDALMASVTVASIGPITAETAESQGLKAEIVAKEYTIDGLCNAIVDHYRSSTS
jgi:uroporphyrinogen III methyltransferase/synthase